MLVGMKVYLLVSGIVNGPLCNNNYSIHKRSKNISYSHYSCFFDFLVLLLDMMDLCLVRLSLYFPLDFDLEDFREFSFLLGSLVDLSFWIGTML